MKITVLLPLLFVLAFAGCSSTGKNIQTKPENNQSGTETKAERKAPGALFAHGTVDITITRDDGLIKLESDVFDYHYKKADDSYEIGLLTFAMDENATKEQMHNISLEGGLTTFFVLMNFFPPNTQMTDIEMPAGMKKYANADGGTALLLLCKGNKTKQINHDFVITNSYYNREKGYVVQLVMFNDAKLYNNEAFNEGIKMFRFNS